MERMDRVFGGIFIALLLGLIGYLGYLLFYFHQNPEVPYAPSHADHSADPVIYEHEVKG